MKKVDKKKWLEEGFGLLASDGFQKITIESMCMVLNITKGSFYHHFKNIDGYIVALMEYWQERNTVDFIKAIETLPNIDEKYIQLNDLVASASQKAEQAIRAWSFTNETVKTYVQQVDGIRMEYLIGLNIQAGMKAEKAKNYAIIEYGTLIGIQQLYPDISKEDLKHLYSVFLSKVAIHKKWLIEKKSIPLE